MVKLIDEIPAVSFAKADWLESTVAVHIDKDSKLEDSEVYDAIKRANFTPGERIK